MLYDARCFPFPFLLDAASQVETDVKTGGFTIEEGFQMLTVCFCSRLFRFLERYLTPVQHIGDVDCDDFGKGLIDKLINYADLILCGDARRLVRLAYDSGSPSGVGNVYPEDKLPKRDNRAYQGHVRCLLRVPANIDILESVDLHRDEVKDESPPEDYTAVGGQAEAAAGSSSVLVACDLQGLGDGVASTTDEVENRFPQ
jgi:hypothetical protein